MLFSPPSIRRAVIGKTLCTLLIAFNQWNDDERNVNVNRNDNDWNDNWWFAGLRNFLYISAFLAEFYLTVFIQPPSILPISSNFSDRRIYFLLSRDFISQAICRKNLSRSSFTELLFRKISFSVLLEYVALIIFSMASKKSESILFPKVYRESLGKCTIYSCHNLYAATSFCKILKLNADGGVLTALNCHENCFA